MWMHNLPVIFLPLLALSLQGDLLDGARLSTHRRRAKMSGAAPAFQNQDNKRSLFRVADETCFNNLDQENIYPLWGTLFGIEASTPNFFDPYYDFVTSCPFKDLSSYIDCDNGGTNCDFAALLNEMKGACEIYGGNLFSITGSVTCLDTAEQQEFSITDRNVPYCIPQGCEVVDISGITDPLQYCAEAVESDYQVEQQASLISQECKDDMSAIGSKGLDFFSIADIIFQDEIPYNEDGVADFGNFINQFLGPCEDAGGYLYKFSDKVSGNELSYYSPEGEIFVNQPLCVGSSCDAEVYFSDVFVRFMKYEFLDGMFPDPNDIDVGQGNCTYPVELKYEFLGYEAVSNIPSPPSPAPTPAPTPAPPTARTSGCKMISVRTACVSMVIVSLITTMFSM